MAEDEHENPVLVLLFLSFVLLISGWDYYPNLYAVFLKLRTSKSSPHQQIESLIHLLKNLAGVL